MAEVLDVAGVLALAPDAASVTAARKLAQATAWSNTGHDGPALWGECQGSGRTPYRTVVDLGPGGPASRCTCPSRKFPCKHALALMLLRATGQVLPSDDVADFAREWLGSRATRAAGQEKPRTPDPEAAAARARQRAERVASGLGELSRWLEDQVRSGLATAERAGYGHFEGIAARMVDAQAPGVAAWLRRLPAVVHSGEGWPGRLLAEYASMSLLVRAHERMAELPAPLAATVRSRVGYPVPKESVLATPPVADRWTVLGLRDSEQDRLTVRRVWLTGHRTGRTAIVLSFTPAGQPPDGSLIPGTSLDADVHFYPGAAPLRALVGERHGNLDDAMPVAPRPVAEARAGVADVLAADPWTTSWPLLLSQVVPARGDSRTVDKLWTIGDAVASLPLAPDAGDPWTLVAISGGHPVDLLADWTPEGLVPVSVLETGGRPDLLVRAL